MVTEQFEAKDEQGNSYLVVVHQKQINTGSLDGEGYVLGLKEYCLANGDALNRLSDTTFEVLQTGRQLTRC